MAKGRYNRDDESPIIRAKGASTAAVCIRLELGACTTEGVSVAMKVAGTAEGVCLALRDQKQLGCLAVGQ